MMFVRATWNKMRDRGFGLPRSRGRGPVVGPWVRRGNVLVLTILLMVVMIGMLAYAIDLGCLVHARTELQRTADASALAAAAKLPDQAVARTAAHSVAEENGWSSDLSEGDQYHGADLDPLYIEFGYWNRDAATFTTPPPYSKSPNAVRVTLRRTESVGNPLKLFFARVFGTSTADVSASATAIYDHWLCGPFVGIDWISVPGVPRTDSYDSQEGPYGWAPPRDRGSICSDGPIGVDGNPIIRGDARAGKGYGVEITGAATITGSVGSRLKPLDLPPVDFTEAAVTNDNAQLEGTVQEGNSWISPVDGQGNFLLDGNKVLNMPQGTYYFNDFSLAGQSVLNLTGPTAIYVTGNMYRGGNVLVNFSSQVPANLKIFVNGGTVNVTSGNDFYGVIYAPTSPVTIDGSADLFGAVVGRTLVLTGSGRAHYDESLHMEEVEFPLRTTLVD